MAMSSYYSRLLISFLLGVSLLISSTTLVTSYAQNNTTDQIGNNTSGGISASEVYQNRMMTFGDNIKNIIILLPNEGHESPEMAEEARLINQPYVPENIVASPGMNIVWLNGDVGHTHVITLVDDNFDEVYSSGEFDFNTVTNPLVLNKTGKFTYSEADVNEEDPKFVMKGTITVSENPSGNANGTSDTVAFFMVPAKDLDEHVSELTNKGVDVLE